MDGGRGGRERSSGAAQPSPAGGRPWAIILAAGQGARLRGLTEQGGASVPKQFCALRGRTTLLRLALERAARVAPAEHLVPVVASEHRRWWLPELADLPPANRVEQPGDRGTAAGVLLPLLHVLRRDPWARVLVLPSDHFVERESVLEAALRCALAAIEQRSGCLVLLGMPPEGFDPDLGWIVPSRPQHGSAPVPVERFREKPAAGEASALRARRAVVNSFIFATRASTLWALYQKLLPEVAERFADWTAAGAREGELERVYAGLPHRDFSRDLLERAGDELSLLAVPPCGWSDVGTPERVARCLAAQPAPSLESPPALPPRRDFIPPLELGRRLASPRPGR
jgi:mannose-1-phosphate guanylyltransferase